jgi:hypothetical protein
MPNDSHFCIVIPSLLLPLWNGPPPPVIQRAVAHSQALEAAIRSVEELHKPIDTLSAARIVQVYYVSVYGPLGLWSIDRKPPLRTFPHTKHWPAAPYVVGLLKDKPGTPYYASKPYFDFGGNGAVQTMAYPVMEAEEDGSRRMVGVIAFDWSIPLDTLLTDVRTMSWLDTWVVLHEGSDRRSRATAAIRLDDLVPQEHAQTTRKDLAAAIRTRGRAVRSLLPWFPETETPPTESEISALKVPDDVGPVYMVPLGRYEEGPLNEVQVHLLVRPRSQVLPSAFWVSLGTAVVGLAAGLACAWIGLRSAKRRHFLDTLIMLYRALPFGVSLHDDKDNIVEANDWAERILDRRLPRPAMQDAHPVPWTSLIDSNVLVPEGSTFTRRPYGSYVCDLRSQGLDSGYYARLSASARWIYVHGAPVFDEPHRGAEGRRTFGIFYEAAYEDADQLERRWKDAR